MPGEPAGGMEKHVRASLPGRQPVHTVYGGAHLFAADVTRKFSARALESLAAYAPNGPAFARALQIRLSERAAEELYARILDKLRSEPVEDYRIDFEDGFGSRSSEEEDRQAIRTAEETATAMDHGLLPPFFGVRIKPFTPARKDRAQRTLEMYLRRLCERAGAALPGNFVVCLPKASSAEEVASLAGILDRLERKLSIAPGSIGMEIMIEQPQTLMDREGRSPLPGMLKAGAGRCRALHFGPYDFTASLGIGAGDQKLDNPVCDAARFLIKIAAAESEISVADGPVTFLPVGPHRSLAGGKLSGRQALENRRVVHAAWRESFRQITRAIAQGYHRGWDLHPAQLPVRYAAVYASYLTTTTIMAARMRHFLQKAGNVTLHGALFDDAATGEGMLNFFRRGIHCGALDLADIRSAGLTVEDVADASIVSVIQRRRADKA